MNAEKILGLLILALSVVGGFVAIPYAGLALLALGLVLGAIIDREGSVRIFATAIVLAGAASHTLDAIPSIGTNLSSIVGNLAAMSAATSISLVARNLWMRFKP
jgi:MFS-type transporter involved in bile tolerance (Atg22 family)